MTSPSELTQLQKHQIRKVFALALVNEKFPDSEIDDRDGAHADRKNIKEFCENNKITVNDFSQLKLKINTTDLKTDELSAAEMGNLFKTISEGDFSNYDAFICFISSHGDSLSGEILGVDGDSIAVKLILRHLNTCSTLVGKPKLFFTQNCRGDKRDAGIRKPKGKVVADRVFSLTIPIQADVLVAYSSVHGYESYRDEEEGSWFITVLTKVLNEHINDMQLTDILAIVNDKIADMEYEDGWKQMPCFTSTLRKSVVFNISDPSA